MRFNYQFPDSRYRVDEFDSERPDILYVKLISSNSLLPPSFPPAFLPLNVRVSQSSHETALTQREMLIAGPFFLQRFRGLRPSTKAPRTLLLGCRPAQTSGFGAPLVATPKNHHLRKFMRRRTRTQHARTGQRTVHRLLSKQGSTVLLFWW